MTQPARIARAVLRVVRAGLWIVLVGSAVLALLIGVARGPQDLPWSPLDLSQPAGRFTGEKLAALADRPDECRRLLWRAGVRYKALPTIGVAPECRVDDAVRLEEGDARSIRFAGSTPPLACPLAAAVTMWEWSVVQPAAQAIYGSRVVAIEHFGSYSCRRIYGRATGDWSEHAHANALDVAGFRLAGGRRVTVAADWRGDDRDARFLRQVRDGGCHLFATVLSPDYNAAHRDHLHLDEAARGRWGWRACR